MPKICYVPREFSPQSLRVIVQANDIIAEYQDQGFDLTLRQLYYQFVSRAVIENSERSYKRLGSIINDARLAGLIDWDAITDRTRNLRELSHWQTAGDIVRDASKQFRMDRWDGQTRRVEVWIEKDALIGVIEDVCTRWDVPYFSCRGYTSQSEMWVASNRMKEHIDNGFEPVVLHLGDHDPSGIDMTRDIEDRIRLFLGEGADRFELKRLALLMPQIEELHPPPNPTKLTDSRSTDYVSRFGRESWELDALSPALIASLIERAITRMIAMPQWKRIVTAESRARKSLEWAAKNWEQVKDARKK